MKRPVKIVYKYKNIHGKYQYALYVFVGNVKNNVKRALKLCEDDDYTAVKSRLHSPKYKNDLHVLQNEFGEDWIHYMFTNEHIAYQKKIKRGGENWFDENMFVINNNVVKVIQDNTKLKQKDIVKPIKFVNNHIDKKSLHLDLRRVWVYQHFIFEDDTLEIIKKKICASIETDLKFGNMGILLPTRIALFSPNKTNRYTPIGYSYEEEKNISIWNIRFNAQQNNSDNKMSTANQETLDNMPVHKLSKYYSSLSSYAYNINVLVSVENITPTKKNDQHMKNLMFPQLMFIDIYHELSIMKERQEMEQKINIFMKTYMLFYFPEITEVQLINIIVMLNGDLKMENTNENKYRKKQNKEINHELSIIEQSTNVISKLLSDTHYSKYTRYETVLNVILRCNLIACKSIKCNTKWKIERQIYHIFNTLHATKKYMFISKSIYGYKKTQKIKEKLSKRELLKHEEKIKRLLQPSKKTQFGITTHMYLEEYDKIFQIYISKNGILEVRTSWYETDKMTLKNVFEKIYPHIIEYINKINNDLALYQRNIKNNLRIIPPPAETFQFINININQYFEVPVTINLQKFQKMLQLFFPFVSSADTNTNAKTKKIEILYTRIPDYTSKVNNNLEKFVKSVIKQRSNMQDHEIIKYIQMQTNMQEQECIDFIKYVKTKNKLDNIKQRKSKLSVDNIKYNEPGLIMKFNKTDTVQKSSKHYYRCSCMGITNKYIFNRIKMFMSCVIYLYIELEQNNKHLLWVKEHLKDIQKLVRISSSLNMREKSTQGQKLSTMKYLTYLDKDRFGFKPDNTNNNNYSRLCEKKKQPHGFADNEDEREELAKLGYTINSDNIPVHESGRLGTMQLTKDGKMRFYICPTKKYPYMGFLPLNRHPDKKCLPCCTIKQMSESPSEHRRDLYKNCMSLKNIQNTDAVKNYSFIKQSGNRVRDNRLGKLPDALDTLLNKKGLIDGEQYRAIYKYTNNRGNLFKTGNDGYFYHLGMTNDWSFLHCIIKILQPSINDVLEEQVLRFKAKITHALKTCKRELFLYLTNGKFKNIDDLVDVIFTNSKSKIKYLVKLISTPGILFKNGLNILQFYFKKKSEIESHVNVLLYPTVSYMVSLEPFKTNSCTIIIIQQNDSYYPVVRAIKPNYNSNTKDDDIMIQRIFSPKMYKNLYPIYKRLYQDIYYVDSSSSTFIYNMLITNGIKPTGQVLNLYFKCEAIVLSNNNILPCLQSEPLPILPLVSKTKIKPWKVSELYAILSKCNKQYSSMFTHFIRSKTKYNTQICNSAGNLQMQIIPTKTVVLTRRYKLKPLIRNKDIHTKINRAIKENKDENDVCLQYINKEDYINDLYQLVRYHVSYILSNNRKLRTEMYNASKVYTQMHTVVKKIFKQFIVIEKKLDASNYKVVNKRIVCFELKKQFCDTINYKYAQGKCRLRVPRFLYEEFIMKIMKELQVRGYKRDELLQREDAFIDDIIDRNSYDEVKGNIIYQYNQYVLREKNVLKKLWENVWISDNTFDVVNGTDIDMNIIEQYEELKMNNPLYRYKNYWIQRVYVENLQFYRAYANCFHWIKNPSDDIYTRNLGYIDHHQERLAIWFRGTAILFLKDLNKKSISLIKKITNLSFQYDKYKIQVFNKLAKESIVPIMIALSMMWTYPINLYTAKYKPLLCFSNGNLNKAPIVSQQSINIRKIDDNKYESMYYFS